MCMKFILQIIIVNLIEQLCSWLVGGKKTLKRGISKNKSNKRGSQLAYVCWLELNAAQ